MTSNSVSPEPPAESVTQQQEPEAHPEPHRLEVPAWLEVLALLVISGSAVVGAQVLGPTTPAGNSVAALGLFAALALVFLLRWLRREPWTSLGLSKPDSWGRTILQAVVATVVLQGAGLFALKVLLPLVGGGAPDSSRFNPLEGNLKLLLGTLLSVWITAAFIEEVVFRGFLMGRLAKIFGGGRGAWIASLVLSSVVFGFLHVYQGAPGVVLTGFIGFLLGALYLLVRRNLWVGILAHGLVDTISLIVIYLGLDI